MAATADFTDAELAAYIAEGLSLERSAALEAAVRTLPALQQRLRDLLAASDDAGLSVGLIWRQQRLSCPSRSTWAAYLADELGGGLSAYLQFHLDDIGCRYCAANVADLRQQAPDADRTRRRYFETSVGRLQQAASNPR